MKKIIFILALFICRSGWAGVFKCTDAGGHIFYQSTPCVNHDKSAQINFKTGDTIDLNAANQQQQTALTQQQQLEQQKLAEAELKRQQYEQLKIQVQAENEITRNLIKQNPLLYSPYAIPPYNPDALPDKLKNFAGRLPDIEKFRRLAAEKALATGHCNRVEADELDAKSSDQQLLIQVNCSSAANFVYKESELK